MFENRLVREALETFFELPSMGGCPPELLTGIERQFGCSLPPLYRDLMESDADRIANIPQMIHPRWLTEHREMAEEILADEQGGYSFRLKRSHLVIAWEDSYGFYFIDANGSDSSPVLLFNYYDDSDNGLPPIESVRAKRCQEPTRRSSGPDVSQYCQFGS